MRKARPATPKTEREVPTSGFTSPRIGDKNNQMRPFRFISLLFFSLPATAQIPEPVWDAHIGTGGADRVEDAFLAPDGSVFVAGTLAAPLENLGDLAVPPPLGAAAADPKYGVALLARLDPDTGAPTAVTQFAPGLLHLTNVLATDEAVYASGYATRGMEEIVHAQNGFMTDFGPAGDPPTSPTPFIHRHDPQIDKARDGRGRPLVLRLTPDLSSITAATFLEGWHHIWHVPRPLNEDRHSPVGLGLLSNGDLVVVHDGGQIQPHPDTGERDNFYHAPDHLSRLSADLSRRRWHTLVETPKVAPARARKLLGDDFPHDWMGNVRTLRLRVAPDDRVFVCGWSASQTMREPWWSPFLFQIDPLSGRKRWSGWTVDPTGGGGRMRGLVSDSVVRSIAFDERGRLLAALNSDGGNNITRYLPNDYTVEKPKLKGDSPWGLRGRTLFIGNVQRLDESREQRLAGANIHGRSNHTATAAWPIDLAALPDEHVFVLGRYTRGFFFKHPWREASRPGAFLRVYDPEFNLLFSTGLEGADLRTVHRRGRLLVVSGATRKPRTLGRGALRAHHGGKSDGYVLLLRIPDATTP